MQEMNMDYWRRIAGKQADHTVTATLRRWRECGGDMNKLPSYDFLYRRELRVRLRRLREKHPRNSPVGHPFAF